MGINKGSGVARATGEWSLEEIRLQWFSIDEGRALQGRLDGAFPVSGRVANVVSGTQMAGRHP
jgi:hypothetical protein